MISAVRPEPVPVHALILTLDEERHIRRCIASVRPYCAGVLVIDSGSRDATRAIAEELGAEVIVHPFTTHAGQVNAGIRHLAGRDGWVLRIDADEVLAPPPGGQLVRPGEPLTGLLVRRRIVFLGRRIRFGGLEPNWQMRLWRNGAARCEQRWMDEHVAIAGEVGRSAVVVSDINLNSVGWWTRKHENYASREAIEMLDRRHGFLARAAPAGGALHRAARVRRFVKNRIYSRLPGAARAIGYFVYRYGLRLGFLDGREGYYFHFLQACWYRTLVDCKIDEIERHHRLHGGDWPAAILATTGIDTRS